MYYDFSPIEVTRILKELLDRDSRKGEQGVILPEMSGRDFSGRNSSGRIPIGGPKGPATGG